jgi:hypothetical protein
MKAQGQPINFLLNLQTHLRSEKVAAMIDIVSIYWVKILATLLIFLALIILFVRSANDQSNISGVDLVQRELDKLNDNYAVFCNVVIHLERGMSQIPYVVVSPYGVFVVACCYHFGKISGQKNDREWRVKAIGVDERILNPLWENRKYVNALEKKLNLSLPFIPLVVFTHAKLIDDFGLVAISVSRLQKFFSRHTNVLIGQADQKSVIAILKE